MPAASQQQQKIMGLALAYKRGEVPASKVSAKVKELAKSMTEKELEKYASTKHKGLPKRIKESDTNESRTRLSTFYQFIKEKEEDVEDVEMETGVEIEPEEKEEMFSMQSTSPMEPVKNKHSYEWSEPESKMMQYQLKNIIENAEELIQMLEGVEDIEDWVQ